MCEVYCQTCIRLTTPLTGSQSNPGATITSIPALEAITFQPEIYALRWKSEVSLRWQSSWKGGKVSLPVCQVQPSVHSSNPILTTRTCIYTHWQNSNKHPRPPLGCLAGVDWGRLSALVRPSHSTNTQTSTHTPKMHHLNYAETHTVNTMSI